MSGQHTSEQTLPTPANSNPFRDGSPMQQILGQALAELGGIEFIKSWAEENPDGFIRLLAAASPPPSPQPQAGGGPTINQNLPAGLAPGPLDAKPVN